MTRGLQPIGEILQETLTSTGTNSISNPEPMPEKCQFCGAVLRHKPHDVFGNGSYITWLAPDSCQCLEAIRQAQIDAEQARIEAEKAETERRRAERERLLQKSGLPGRYHEAIFANANITKTNKDAYARALAFVEHPSGGLLLSGPVGTGKTHLAACIVNSFLDNLRWVIFGGVIELLGRIRRTYSDGSREDEWQIIDSLTNCTLLVLDDLGKEKVTDWVEQTLFRVVDARYQNKRLTVVTTNFTMPELQSRYDEVGPALVSRLTEMCAGVLLDGEDWRMKRLK